MKIYLPHNVYDAALERFQYVFSEFDNVVVNFSGGKDSTVILNLAIEAARKLNRLPIRVQFIDQEGEWRHTVEYMRRVQARPEVQMDWYQIPIQIENATSRETEWLQCWDPGSEDLWMRPKEPDAIKENIYGTKAFYEVMDAICDHNFPDQPAAILNGVRAEESPQRFMGMTSYLTYKNVTWGKKINDKKGHYAFSPIYDWSYRDVWKSIIDNKWDYNRIYPLMFAHGEHLHKMRVSNLHHGVAVKDLFYLQELEPDTYSRLVKRLPGINTAKKMNESKGFIIKELPYMFGSWMEYRDYLLEHLVTDKRRPTFIKHFERVTSLIDRRYPHHREELMAQAAKVMVKCILLNDYHFTKLNAWQSGAFQGYKPADLTPENRKYRGG